MLTFVTAGSFHKPPSLCKHFALGQCFYLYILSISSLIKIFGVTKKKKKKKWYFCFILQRNTVYHLYLYTCFFYFLFFIFVLIAILFSWILFVFFYSAVVIGDIVIVQISILFFHQKYPYEVPCVLRKVLFTDLYGCMYLYISIVTQLPTIKGKSNLIVQVLRKDATMKFWSKSDNRNQILVFWGGAFSKKTSF